MLLGSLSNEDDYDSIENVAKRMRFASFQTSSRTKRHDARAELLFCS